MGDLKMKVETPDVKLTVLRLNGEFENMAVINAKDELFGHLNKAKTSNFMLDFGEISYIDSALTLFTVCSFILISSGHCLV